MAIKVACACGKKLSVKDEHAGKRVKCPACQKPLRIPRPQVEEKSLDEEWGTDDEWDFDDEQAEAPVRSRRAKPSSARGSVSRKGKAKGKGKNSSGSNRGLLIGLSAGAGVLVVVVLTWLLWPDLGEDNVAVNPSSTEAETANSGTAAPGAATSVTPAGGSPAPGMPVVAATSAVTTTGTPTSTAPAGPAPEVAMPRALTKLPDEIVQDAPFDVSEFWVSVPADQNAAPFYLDAMFEFHPSVAVCFPEAGRAPRMSSSVARAKRSYSLLGEWSRDVSKRNTAERDAVLKEHEIGFQKLMAAQQRPRCVFETGWDVPAIGSLFIAARRVSRLSILQVERDIERGDFDAAIQTTGMLLRLSRDLRVRTPLGVQFLSDAIDVIAGSNLVMPLLRSPTLTAEQCAELLRMLTLHDTALQELNPALTRLRADYVHRRLLLYQVQHSIGEFAPEGLNSAFGSSCDSLGAALQASVNYDQNLAKSVRTNMAPPEMAQLLDVVIRGMKPTDYEACVRILKKKYQSQENVLGQSYAAQSATFLDLFKKNRAATDSFQAAYKSAAPTGSRGLQAAVAIPILEKILADEDASRGALLLAFWVSKFENDVGEHLYYSEMRGATRRSATLALAALRHWYATHSETPTDLASVCRAAGLPDVPRDFFGGGPIRMRTFSTDSPPIQYPVPHHRPTDKPKFLAGESVIYSVGLDGIDDKALSDGAGFNSGPTNSDWPFTLSQPQSSFPPTPGESGR
jgi:hypothetical protein